MEDESDEAESIRRAVSKYAEQTSMFKRPSARRTEGFAQIFEVEDVTHSAPNTRALCIKQSQRDGVCLLVVQCVSHSSYIHLREDHANSLQK